MANHIHIKQIRIYCDIHMKLEALDRMKELYNVLIELRFTLDLTAPTMKLCKQDLDDKGDRESECLLARGKARRAAPGLLTYPKLLIRCLNRCADELVWFEQNTSRARECKVELSLVKFSVVRRLFSPQQLP